MSGGVDRREALGFAAAAAGVLLSAPPARATLGGTRPVGGLTATRLRCEWRFDPVGIDTLEPRFHWEPVAIDTPGQQIVSSRVIVATSEAELMRRHGDVWDSGKMSGARPWAKAPRLALTSHRRYHFAVALEDAKGVVRWSAPSSFTTAILDPREWKAEWIAAGPEWPARAPHVRGQDKGPPSDPATTVLPLMRRSVTLAAKPVRAIVSMAGLGHGTLVVNGKPATDALLDPAWSEYSKTVFYATYDVTDLLQAGENVLGVMLGNGMFNVERKADRKSKFVETYGRPRLIFQMSIDAVGGERQQILSDSAWQVTEGPILFSSIFGGEDVDHRCLRSGWDHPGYSADTWRGAHPIAAPAGKLRAQSTEPVKAHATFTGALLSEPRPGTFIYDLGTNFAGRPVLVLRGKAGAAVRILPAEVLGEDGLVFQRSFNAGPGRWVEYNCTLAGDGDERFAPQFNYHGFRYLQIEGAVPVASASDDLPRIVSVSGEFMHADLDQVGTFECSKPLFVDTHRLIERAVLSNAVSVLTDCPHREKLGWLEQTHLNAATVTYNRDAAALYEKTIVDIVDTQRASDGMVPGIAPEYMEFLKPDGSDDDPRSSPEWGCAIVLSAWAAYRTYGDATALATGYPAMKRYMAYLAGRAQDRIVDFGLGDWYDVGPGKLGASQLTSRALTATASWYQSLDALVRIGRILGRPGGEIAAFQAEARRVRDALNRRFFDAGKGSYDRGSQTANAMPLALGMVPKGREADVLAALVRAVRSNGNAVNAGDVGFHYVVRALTLYRRDDVMFDMMSVTDRPSYGYQLAKGATALTEAWNADPTKSLNHFMLGHGEGWLFGGLAGIQVDFAASQDRILTVDPRPAGDVQSAGATLRTVLGEVVSRWTRRDKVFDLDVTIPTGATATIVVPTSNPASVRVSAADGTGPVARASGVVSSRVRPGALELIVRGGRYRLAAPYGAS